ncbi:hypothetical protein PanWU01x14_128810, partial [Parasponia andersonii]
GRFFTNNLHFGIKTSQHNLSTSQINQTKPNQIVSNRIKLTLRSTNKQTKTSWNQRTQKKEYHHWNSHIILIKLKKVKKLILRTRLVWKHPVAALRNLFEDGHDKIKVKGQLSESEKGYWEAQSCIQRISYES